MAPNLQMNLAIPSQSSAKRRQVKDFVSIVNFQSYYLGQPLNYKSWPFFLGHLWGFLFFGLLFSIQTVLKLFCSDTTLKFELFNES